MHRNTAITLVIAVVLIGGALFPLVGGLSAAMVSPSTDASGPQTAAAPIADLHPAIAAAMQDWAKDQDLSVKTEKRLKKAIGTEVSRKEIYTQVSAVRTQYKQYDLPLLVKMYSSGVSEVDVIIEYPKSTSAEEVSQRLSAIDNDVRVTNVFEDIRVITVHNLDVKRIDRLGSKVQISSVGLNQELDLSPVSTTDSESIQPYDNRQIGVSDLWKAGFRGQGMKIAVVDSGIDDEHPDLNALPNGSSKILAQAVFVDTVYTEEPADDGVGHGTHVAGIVAGTGDASNQTIMGVAPRAQLLNAKVFNANEQSSEEAILEAIDWAVRHNADVITMSLGTNSVRPNGESAMSQKVDWAVNHGVSVTIASGNDGQTTFWDYLRP